MSVIPVRMPKWGLSMQEGTITAWHVEAGQPVGESDDLCDIETAKIVNAFQAPIGGVVALLTAEAGDVVAVGKIIAVLTTAGEDAEAVKAAVRQEQDFGSLAKVPPEGARLQEVITSAGPISYLEIGDRKLATTVLLHGFGGDHTGWTLTQGALAATCRTIAFDLPGHGRSTRAVGDGSAEALGAILREAMDSIGLGPVRLIAHSFGAKVARALVAEGRDVRSTILIAPAGFGAAVDDDYVQGFVASRRKRDLRPLMQRLFARPEALGRDMVSNALGLLNDDTARSALRRIADGIAAAPVGNSDWPGVWSVIWGGRDRIIPLPGDLATALGERLTLLSGSGHLPQLEEADLVNRLLVTKLSTD